MTPDAGAPPVDQALRAALARQDREGLAQALTSSLFLVPLVDGASTRTPLLVVDADERRLLPVFSGADALRAWGRGERYGGVSGRGLVDLVREQGVDAVLFDPAGPAAAELAPRLLEELLDGVVPGAGGGHRTTGALRVRPAPAPPEALLAALRDAARDYGTAVWLFERAAGSGAVLTVGVAGQAQAAQLASRLGQVPGLPVVDVLALPPDAAAAVAAQVPGGRITG